MKIIDDPANSKRTPTSVPTAQKVDAGHDAMINTASTPVPKDSALKANTSLASPAATRTTATSTFHATFRQLKKGGLQCSPPLIHDYYLTQSISTTKHSWSLIAHFISSRSFSTHVLSM
jgi:hypothetical protein